MGVERMKESGFTLIELVIVIVILSILAVVAIPRYVNLKQDALEAQEAGVVAGVRGGITADHADRLVNGSVVLWPPVLDNINAGFPVRCDLAPTPCFELVLEQGAITSATWTKTGAQTYEGPALNIYTYDPIDGSFE